MRNRAAISFITAALWVGQSLAQTPAPISNTDLSKDVENPVSRQITLPLRYEADFDDGAYNAAKETFEIDQAVVPFRLNEDWALITRTKLPLESLPPKKLGEHWTFGLSNGYTTFFLSPEHGQGFYWGAGPVLYYPTATNPALGVNKWGSGPSAAFLHKDQGPWDFGAVVNNIWSFGGPTTGSDRTNQLFLNPIVNYHFGDGWSVGSSPEITTNWFASGGKWTVPVGGGFGKLFRVDGQAVRVDLDSYYNAVRPQAGNETWLVQLKLTFVFPDRSAVNSKGSEQ
jgi:hypothetical protein